MELFSDKKYRRFICIFFYMIVSISSIKSNDIISNNLVNFNLKYPTEKVYLHFDNNSYYLGDTIWFKAYIRDGVTGLRSDISRVLYVELLCDLGFVREIKKLKINNGVCDGFFSLSDTLYRGGFYELRAKTKGMLSFGNESQLIIHRHIDPYISKFFYKDEQKIEQYKNYLYSGFNNRWEYWGFQHSGLNISSHVNYYQFSKVIPIYDRVHDGDYHCKSMRKGPIIGEGNRSKIKDIFIEFFPEGGSIIKGLSTKVGFEIKDKSGVPIKASGYIKSRNGEIASQISTKHNGIGYFYLNPNSKKEIDNSYYAYINYDDKEYKFNLPNATDFGFSLTTEISRDSNIIVRIKYILSEKDKNKKYNLVVISPSNKNKNFPVKITTDNIDIISFEQVVLEEGINRFLICDSEGTSYIDRLVYIDKKNPSAYNLTILGLKQKYLPYEKIELDILLTDNKGIPISTDFSVSIRDKKWIEKSYNTDNILSYFLISSDIGRFIPNCSQYIGINNAKLQEELDLYMLTTKRRRYQWNELMLKNNPIIPYHIEKGLTLSGYVIDATRNNKKNNIRLLENMHVEAVLAFDSLEFYGEMKSDKNGYFKFSIPDYYGSVYAKLDIVESKSNNRSSSKFIKNYYEKYYIPIDRIISTFPREYDHYEKMNIDLPIEAYNSVLDTLFYNVINLDSVTINAKQKRRRLQRGYPIYKSNILDEFNNSLDYGDIMCGNMSKYILYESSIPNYPFEYSDMNIWCNIPIVGSTVPEEVYCVNNDNKTIHLSGINKINKPIIQLRTIENVEVYSSYGPRSFYDKEFIWSKNVSDIRFYFYKTDGYKRAQGNNLRLLHYNGYSYRKSFFHPKYSENIHYDTKDYRRTLYWNPNLATDEYGKAKIEFYNNTTCQELDITIETLTDDGIPIFYEQ